MSERPFPPVGLPVGHPGRPGPIDRIARAEAPARGDAAGVASPDALGGAPDLQPVPQPLAPQGLAGAVDEALGPVRLPTLIELAEALGAARGAARLAGSVDPGLGDVVAAVLADEERKVMRYLDLRNR